METKHTPGPWRIFDVNGEGTPQVCNNDKEPIDLEDEDNAHLIAAAPELLAALEMALSDPDSEILGEEWADFAQSAIAKATND